MLETECFQELNIWGPNSTPTSDLLGDAPPEEDQEDPCCSIFMSRKKKRKVYIFLT